MIGEDKRNKVTIMNKVFITGSAGFIGFHLANLLISRGVQVHGFDGMTDYYDVNLKKERHRLLLENAAFSRTIGLLEDKDSLVKAVEGFKPDVIVHLAAKAGVRYSLENPRAYLESNLVGTFNVMECARDLRLKHLLMASTSSVYGANIEMPYSESTSTDRPLTFYAATKKANEIMAHSYSHLWGVPTTMFRFFTVYGPWGRPDMALFKFVKNILEGREIDVYNHGQMYRDFTYVSDLVEAIRLLIDVAPTQLENKLEGISGDTLSPVAPFRVVNIGNSTKVKLLDFVSEIEKCLGVKADVNFMDMQTGDVPATWADASLLKNLTGYQPATDISDGIKNFVDWYCQYYEKEPII